MLIILARHGNTFNPGDRVYRVGKRNNLSLTSQGLIQAEVFANTLINKKIIPTAVYCGPLIRTKQFAQTMVEKMKLKMHVQIDECLNELDYGGWAGLTDEEIILKYRDDLTNWNTAGVWPKHSEWPESESEIIASLKKFISQLVSKHDPNDVIVVVSSSGKLRYFLKLVDNVYQIQLEHGGVTVKTGNGCKVRVCGDTLKVEAWNISPSEF